MKSFFKFCFVTIGLIVMLASCKKEDPEPILADQMAGEYNGTYYTVGGTTRVTLPATNTSGVTATSKISVIKISDETATFRIKFTLTDKAGKSSDSFSTHESLTLKKSSSGEIEGYQGTTKLASLINGELGVTFPNADPKSIVVFYGKK